MTNNAETEFAPLATSMEMFRERLLRKAYRPRRRPVECPKDVYTCEDEFKALVNAGQATQPMDRAAWHKLCNDFSDKWEHICHWVHPSRLADFLTEDMGLEWEGEFPIKPATTETRVKVKVKSNVKAQRFKCSECNVICNSYSQYLIHIEGTKHKDNLEQCIAKAKEDGKEYISKGALPLDTEGEVDPAAPAGQPQAYFKKDPNAPPTPPTPTKSPSSRPSSCGRSSGSGRSRSRSATPSSACLTPPRRASSGAGSTMAAMLALAVGSNVAVSAPSVRGADSDGDYYEPDPHASYLYQQQGAHTCWAEAMGMQDLQDMDDDLMDEDDMDAKDVKGKGKGKKKKKDEEEDEAYESAWVYDNSYMPSYNNYGSYSGYEYSTPQTYVYSHPSSGYNTPPPSWAQTPPVMHMEPSGRVRNDPYANYGVYEFDAALFETSSFDAASSPHLSYSALSSDAATESDSVAESEGLRASMSGASASSWTGVLDEDAELIYSKLQRELSAGDIEVLSRLRQHVDFDSHAAAAAITKLVSKKPDAADTLAKSAAAVDAEVRETIEQEVLSRLSAGPQVSEIMDNMDSNVTDHLEEQNIREAVAYTAVFTFAIGLFLAGAASSESFSKMLQQYVRNVTCRDHLPAEAFRVLAPAWQGLVARAHNESVAVPEEAAAPTKLRALVSDLAAAAAVPVSA
eukprot:TRINITY_DN4025_c0_g1_i2.p1 TRINITY_DN4025_c0_g1~~TRINITY_DN4025_c0_g1_i2.p1  ORF type:complete len:684 (+),score=267.75 TRINITY_DN4025_c0_g1_i2:108-2159(+)